MHFDFENHKFREEFLRQFKNYFKAIQLTDGSFLDVEYDYDTERKTKFRPGRWTTDDQEMQVNMVITMKFRDEAWIMYRLLVETGVTIDDCYAQCKSRINDFIGQAKFDYQPKFVVQSYIADSNDQNIMTFTIMGRHVQLKRTYTMNSSSNDIYVKDTCTNSADSSWNYGKLRFTNPSGT